MDKFRLLVVDDSPVSRMWLKNEIPVAITIISEIKEAENGLIALNLNKEFKPNLVFMDLTMPVMDGFEAIKEIIKHDSDAKIIVVSSNRQESTRKMVIDAGAMSIISKPIEQGNFKKMLVDALYGA